MIASGAPSAPGAPSAYEEDVWRAERALGAVWDELANKTVLITGATGLVGGFCAAVVLAHNASAQAGMRVMLPVRSLERARARFGEREDVRYVAWDAAKGTIPQLEDCDFIIHCASNTNSRRMVEQPVDTICGIVHGTEAMLELARLHHARLVFASSMEVYAAGADEPLAETCGGALDAMNVRSSYPQAKQLAETLCASYASQYGVDACVARLAQTFGPGIARDDARVFAQFARCCLEGQAIELLTDGSKRNMYCDLADAACALLTLAAKGAAGEAYNVANESTYCSIYEMAQMVARTFGNGIEVRRCVDAAGARRFGVSGSIYLDTSKMRALGWQPQAGLEDMYRRMIAAWQS